MPKWKGLTLQSSALDPDANCCSEELLEEHTQKFAQPWELENQNWNVLPSKAENISHISIHAVSSIKEQKIEPNPTKGENCIIYINFILEKRGTQLHTISMPT